MSGHSENENIIVCKDVNKWYGEYHALRDVSLTVKQKTAYEIRLSLVGSEMCIRDRFYILLSENKELSRVWTL